MVTPLKHFFGVSDTEHELISSRLPMTLQPHPHRRQSRRLSTCHRHPTTAPATGFCASCLRERLAGIQNDSSSLTTRIPTSSTSQLRRSKSCSGVPDPSSSASEPHRKSCDVSSHSTLHRLLAVDDKIKTLNVNIPPLKIEVFQSFEEEEDEGELKTMKEFIDLECRTKKHSGKSLWDSASVFSKKLKKWRKKQSKTEKKEGFVLEKENRKGSRDTQYEIGEYGLFGRRSCDIDPRLSVDFGCLLVDEPRASWDGCLIGKQKPKVNEEPKPKPSVGEDRLSVVKEEERVSAGGSAQTRNYYGESLSRRRRSFDRSGSNRKVSFEEAEEFRSSISNAKVSPETVGLFHGAKLLVTEKELRDSNWYSHVESGSKDVELVGNKEVNLKKAKGWKNVWSIWSLIPRRKQSEFGDEDRNVRGDLGNVRLVESLQKPRRVANGDDNKGIGGNVGEGILVDSLQKLTQFANGDESKGIGGNVADASLAESLLKLRRVVNGVRDSNGNVVRQKLLRSYSVSAQNSVDGPSLYGTSVTRNFVDGSSLYGTSVTRNSVDGSSLYGMSVTRNSVDGSSLYGTSVIDFKSDGTKRRDNHMLQPNRSDRHSPNNLDNGLLRFYLTPLRSYRRSKSGKSRLRNSNSIGGSIF